VYPFTNECTPNIVEHPRIIAGSNETAQHGRCFTSHVKTIAPFTRST